MICFKDVKYWTVDPFVLDFYITNSVFSYLLRYDIIYEHFSHTIKILELGSLMVVTSMLEPQMTL